MRLLPRLRHLAVGLAAAVAVLVGLDLAFPPDLSRYRDHSTVIRDIDGHMLRAFTSSDGMWRLQTRPEDVDPLYLKFLMAYEDHRFYEHPGVDPLAVVRAIGQMIWRGHVVSGASTLTMQTARLLQPHRRDLLGKLAEMARAVQLELHYSKTDILTMYLTLAPFGGNLEGVRAASLAYFGKEPRHLDPSEAALLVALPQSPERRRPDLRPQEARAARDQVLERLVEHGVITETQAATARTRATPTRRIALPFLAPHMSQSLATGVEQGSVVRTTLRAGVQSAMERLLHSEAEQSGDGAAFALVALDNRTRQVMAYVGSNDFFSAAGQNDLVRARRSPGSALKPFAYALAFEDGFIHPETLIEDEPMRFGDYTPHNFDRDYQGTISVRRALQQSLNLPAVAIVQRVGPERFSAALQQSGATLTYPPGLPGGSLATVLGGVGISLFDLTGLYSGLASGGRMATPTVLADHPAVPRGQFVSSKSAWYVTDILRGSAPPPGWAPLSAMAGSRHIAFKTGTSYGFRDAWAIGYSPTFTVGVWTGYANGRPHPGHYGQISALPVLLKAFDLLPPEEPNRLTIPADVVRVSSNLRLPPALRRFTLNPVEAAATGYGPRARNRPRIVYPPDGATIDLRGRPQRARDLVLKADGGIRPLHWVINGRPLPTGQERNTAFWTPDGDGFARIAVIDADGRSSMVRIRLQTGD